MRGILSDILGADTVEYQQLGHIDFDLAPAYMGRPTPLFQVRDGYARGFDAVIVSVCGQNWVSSATTVTETPLCRTSRH